MPGGFCHTRLLMQLVCSQGFDTTSSPGCGWHGNHGSQGSGHFHGIYPTVRRQRRSGSRPPREARYDCMNAPAMLKTTSHLVRFHSRLVRFQLRYAFADIQSHLIGRCSISGSRGHDIKRQTLDCVTGGASCSPVLGALGGAQRGQVVQARCSYQSPLSHITLRTEDYVCFRWCSADSGVT